MICFSGSRSRVHMTGGYIQYFLHTKYSLHQIICYTILITLNMFKHSKIFTMTIITLNKQKAPQFGILKYSRIHTILHRDIYANNINS